MGEGLKILVSSVLIFVVLVLSFLGFSLYILPDLKDAEEKEEVLPASDVLSVVDKKNDYAYQCPDSFEVFRVPGDYPTIQEAIDFAQGGTIIIVSPGIYSETITLKSEICLIAEEFGKSEIRGFGGNVIEASGKNQIKNFKIASVGKADSGIAAVGAQEVNVDTNTFENLKHGVLSSNNSKISVSESAFRDIDVGVFIKDSSFFLENIHVHNASVAVDITSSDGDAVGMTIEGGEYGLKAKSSDVFLDSNNFRDQSVLGMQLCRDGDYELGSNFFNENVNEDILYKE